MSTIKWHTEDNKLIPERSTKHSVGFDFKSPEAYTIYPSETCMIDTKVSCEFSSDKWLGIYGRSSLGAKGIVNPLGVGVIDADYFDTGNTIKVVLTNNSDEIFVIEKYDKIAQGVFMPAFYGDKEVTTERVGGFGSTDEKLPLTVKFKRGEYKACYAKLQKGKKTFTGIFVDFPENEEIFISKDTFSGFHSASSCSYLSEGENSKLSERCWFVSYIDITPSTKEEASNDFIESLIVKEE